MHAQSNQKVLELNMCPKKKVTRNNPIGQYMKALFSQSWQLLAMPAKLPACSRRSKAAIKQARLEEAIAASKFKCKQIARAFFHDEQADEWLMKVSTCDTFGRVAKAELLFVHPVSAAKTCQGRAALKRPLSRAKAACFSITCIPPLGEHAPKYLSHKWNTHTNKSKNIKIRHPPAAWCRT